MAHIRSNSLPSSVHPIILRIKEELVKLKGLEASQTAEAILIALESLKDLYTCVDDLLHLLFAQQVLVLHRREKWVDEMLNGSIQLMDLCSSVRDALSSMKEHMQALQSTLRRRRAGDPSIKCEIRSYFLYRKKAEKDLNKSLSKLKKIGNGCPLLNENNDTSMVFKVLQEVTVVTISIFQSVLCFMASTSPVTRPNKWSLVSKVMRKGTVACEGEDGDVNLVQRVDASLSTLCRHDSSKDDDVKVSQVQKRMVELEGSIERIDGGLECLFRQLIQTRVALLNNISL
ncbi:hypothetical protein QJS04_geneDACA001351 [Acorus gramineus]|uniref:Uncharacterized protein n=1 Tax=Acorus gramineus TaxID=55184 RepID=A0AAV9ADD3_ACOGR|nr:hypothetical protein QJS04_geneDACA001351 [Acorus gramineus]